MSKKEKFKLFASRHPNLLKHVESGNKTWQDFYEMFDIYGDDESKWQDFLTDQKNDRTPKNTISSIPELIKNIDVDSVQKHINTAQKALGFIQDFTTKSTSAGAGLGAVAASLKGPKTPRPVNKFFED